LVRQVRGQEVMMDRSLARSFSALYQISIPFAVALFCVMFTMLPWGLSLGVVIAPSFALMAVYYWGLYRPDLMPPFAVFLVGLFQDLLSGGPLGLWSLVFLAVYGVVVSQRLFFIGKAFLAIWFGFGVMALVAGVISWMVSCLYFGMILSPLSVTVQALLSFILYPVTARIFTAVQKQFLTQP
jgi:rod shape-determining protein MreD